MENKLWKMQAWTYQAEWTLTARILVLLPYILNTPRPCLINPAKIESVRISKAILDNITFV